MLQFVMLPVAKRDANAQGNKTDYKLRPNQLDNSFKHERIII